ncbi:MAG: endonuclease/exonuclease/phosphatase family protein, partial [Myxococcales bacterium]|nr:endonuclease/exonuclease/phosphatase family protein [Myxococcales bacterium]
QADAGNTELNVIVPNNESSPGVPAPVDIQDVEYTINCLGNSDTFLDNNASFPDEVQINGNLEVQDGRTDPQGPIPPEFGTPRPGDGAEIWQAFMDLPPGDCTVQLRARDNDGEVICTAQEDVTIAADTTVKVNLVLICQVSYQAPVGMLDVDATFSFVVGNFCPDLFQLNCLDSAPQPPFFGVPIAATSCEVRFRDGDSTCGEGCDPQSCNVVPEGLVCFYDPNGDNIDDGDPPPVVETTITCGANALLDCEGDLVPDASCTYSGDTLGIVGDQPPVPVAVGGPGPNAGGFYVACDPAGVPGATITCTAVTTDGDNDCDKTKVLSIDCPGLSPCQNFGDDAACQAAASTVCQAGTCNEATCDGASAAACCDYVAAADGIDCSSEIPEPNGECQGGVCVSTSCTDDASCDTDGNDCTFAPPGTCDLGSSLCDPLADRPPGFSCNGDTGTCDGGGTCIDNCTSVDCSDGNECTQDLCDPTGGLATCSNPDEVDGTSCDAGGGPGSGTCQSGACIGLRVETFNLALAGAFIPYEQERRQSLPAAIAATQSDILCLQEVWSQADKDAIRAAALPSFPYIASFLNDLDTPLDDATDQNGLVPPAPTTVPCPDDVEVIPGTTIADQMNAAIDCVRDGSDSQGNPCSTIPGSDDGRTTSTACAAEACTVEVAGLILGTGQQQRCYACLATQLPTDTFGTIRGRCPTVVNQELAFQGQNGVMILSRYPLNNVVNWVIPGTWNRRVILSATAEHPSGTDVDVFCNHLTPIFDDLVFPYTGQYGAGLTYAAGWEAEQFLQAQKLIAHVQSVSGSRPAVILGDLNTGRGYFDDPGNAIFPEGEPTLDLLESVFTPAYAADYTPACTFCQENPVAGIEREATVWIDHIHMYNLPATAVTATERTFDQNVLTVPDGTGGTIDIPLSDHYGMRSVIVVP